MSYIALLGWPMIALGWVVNLFQQGMASMKRLTAVFNVSATIASPAQPIRPENPTGTIEYAGVGLKYDQTWILRDICI